MLETTVPVAGLITSRRSPSEASRHSPLMNNLPGRILGAVAMAEISLCLPKLIGLRDSMKIQMIEFVNYFFYSLPYKEVVNPPEQRCSA
jgi:hypothetical protein